MTTNALPGTPFDEEIADRKRHGLSAMIGEYEQQAYRRALADLAPQLAAAALMATALTRLAYEADDTDWDYRWTNGAARPTLDTARTALALWAKAQGGAA